MGIILVLIPISLVLIGFACWAFFWAVGTGQFEDLDAQAWDILAEDEPAVDAAPSPPGERRC